MLHIPDFCTQILSFDNNIDMYIKPCCSEDERHFQHHLCWLCTTWTVRQMWTKVHQILDESHQETSVSLKILRTTLLMKSTSAETYQHLPGVFAFAAECASPWCPCTCDCTTGFIFLQPLTPSQCQCVVILSTEKYEQLRA